jgi:poly(A) polymerase
VIPERFASLISKIDELAERFNAAGFALYLVGGVVRDALVDALASDADLDLTTNARPEQIKKIVSDWADEVWTIGEKFGTIGFQRGQVKYEVTTHRAEAYVVDSRKPKVEFSDSIEADLSRRDFTINAMALRLPQFEVIDPYGGLEDLSNKRLRTPLSPQESFDDDPLRMMRAARFIARFSLSPDDDLIKAVTDMRDRMSIVSRERIRDELDKLVVVEKPSPGLWFLSQTGLSDEFLPELNALALEQDPVHRHKDVLAHTIAVVERAPSDRILRLAALLHDIGKPKTRAIGDEGVTFHHHELVGARMTCKRMTELRYSGDDIDAVARLVELHLRFHGYDTHWTDSAVRRYVRDAGPLLWQLNELTRADCTTRNAQKAEDLARRMDALEQRIDELRKQEEIDAIRPDLDGNEVMQILKLKPGRDVGDALDFLMEIRLDEGPIGKEAATERLVDWWGKESAK